MKFFKHFVEAHRGSSLQILKQQHGMAGIGRYWTLVELCAEKLRKEDDEEFTEAHCHFAFEKSYLAQCLAYANHAHLMRYLGDIQVIGLCSFDANEVQVVCSMPKLLESMDRDTKRARKERAPGAPKNKIKNKDKELDKEEEYISAEPSNLVPLIPQSSKALIKISSDKHVEINSDLIKSWAETYPKEFLDMEVKKARSWVLANPQKSPKSGWGRFFNSWFDRGWEQYRKTLKSNPSAISVDDLNDLLGAS